MTCSWEGNWTDSLRRSLGKRYIVVSENQLEICCIVRDYWFLFDHGSPSRDCVRFFGLELWNLSEKLVMNVEEIDWSSAIARRASEENYFLKFLRPSISSHNFQQSLHKKRFSQVVCMTVTPIFICHSMWNINHIFF